MGKKGSKLTKKATEMCQQFIDTLAGIGEITSRKMFGGYGIFENAVMFALVNPEGGIFLKVNESNISLFEKEGSTSHGKMPYYEIPGKVLKDQALLVEWARDSIEIARLSKKK